MTPSIESPCQLARMQLSLPRLRLRAHIGLQSQGFIPARPQGRDGVLWLENGCPLPGFSIRAPQFGDVTF